KLDKVDVVTIGVGWTGGIVAAELSKEGYQVVGLERGKELTTKDFALKHDELRYAKRHELMQDLSRDTLTFRNSLDQSALPRRQYVNFILCTGVRRDRIHSNKIIDRLFP